MKVNKCMNRYYYYLFCNYIWAKTAKWMDKRRDYGIRYKVYIAYLAYTPTSATSAACTYDRVETYYMKYIVIEMH